MSLSTLSNIFDATASGLAAVVEMDASNAILMDASLHNYRQDGDGDGIDEYDESQRHHLLYLLVRAERIDDLMFKFVRTHIHGLAELKYIHLSLSMLV
jgi:hypothetical protein